MSNSKHTVRYASYGALFGVFFPVLGTLIETVTTHGSASPGLWPEVQAATPLLWIIDTAPLFLGLFAALAGRRQDALSAAYDQLSRTNTALEQTNATLEETNAQLIEASQLKSQFLANMSHELRTPLNAIIGFSRLVLRKTKELIPARQVRNLEMVHESGQHLLEMVNDLLDIERIEAGMLRVTPTELEADELMADVVAKLRPAAEEKGLALRVTVDSGPLVIRSDQVRLRQILDNLVSNAIKYSDKGRIEVRVTRTPEQVRFVVADQGKGIPEEQRERVFDAFHQVDGSATRAQGGVGLGLHLVRRLAELLGGTVSVESELDVGSTFTFALPASSVVQRDTARSPGTRSPGPKGEGPVLLVIDDQPEALELLQTELVDDGFRVHTAASGEEGLEKAADLRPDAILLDIVMPKVDGWTVLKRLRASPELARIPVVVTSMLSESPQAWDLGIVAWLTKPVAPHEFRDIFARVGIAAHDDVLVVEDDAPTRSMLLQGLSEAKVSFRSVPDGPSAVSALDDRLPRALVLDLMLPHLDGFQVLAHLRNKPAGGEVPVVVYTAMDLSDEDKKRLNGGVVEIINKASAQSMHGVVSCVRRALRNAGGDGEATDK